MANVGIMLPKSLRIPNFCLSVDGSISPDNAALRQDEHYRNLLELRPNTAIRRVGYPCDQHTPHAG